MNDGKESTITEEISSGLTRSWKIYKTLYSEITEHQKIDIVETAHGITLFCNNERQSSELSQQAYHEGQIIPALLAMKSSPKTALVIGSSEGVICKILESESVKRIDHVDIDETCLLACSQYLPYGYTPEEVNRYREHGNTIKITFMDGIDFINRSAESGATYDLIAMDLPDISPSTENLYSRKLYKTVKNILNPEGVLITQAGNPSLWRVEGLRQVWETLRECFQDVTYFSIPEQEWSWIIAFKDREQVPPKNMSARLKQLKTSCQYIDATSLQGATILPISIRGISS